jgi:copper resistance protein D
MNIDPLNVVARTTHFASCLALFGGFVFLLWVARPTYRVVGAASEERDLLWRRLRRSTRWGLVAALLSGGLWFSLEAVEMSGMSVREALGRETLQTVIEQTQFGRVWLVRLWLLFVLGVLLAVAPKRAGERDWARFGVAGGGLAGALLATLAWSGHAIGGHGVDRYIHAAADSVHLLAAGAWLGALPPLITVLSHSAALPGTRGATLAALAARRFSSLGVLSVTAIVLSGMINARYLVGSVPGLFSSTYGRELLAKLALFGAMLVLAAINRWRLTPQLSATTGGSAAALRRLRRNAILETVLGVGVVAVVGALGITVPAAHIHLHRHT